MSDEQWRPVRGQVVFLDVERPGGDEPERLSGLVMGELGGDITVDLGLRGSAGAPGTEVVASFVSPAALYRLRAKVKPRKDAPGLIDLTATADVERVQRRAHPRVAVALATSLASATADARLAVTAAETTDLSAGGLSALAQEPLPGEADAGVVVVLALPNAGLPVLAVSEVVAAESTGAGVRYRLSFTSLAEEDQERIARFVVHRSAEQVEAQT